LTYKFSAFALQNKSALVGVEVNPEAYSCNLSFEMLQNLVVYSN